MWPIALLALAVTSFILWYRVRSLESLRLDLLALISGGAAVMFLVDSIFSYIEEGVFLDLSWQAATLSALLVVLAIGLWAAALLLTRLHGRL